MKAHPAPKKTAAAPPRSRVLLLDDHPIVRHGLTMLINREPDMEVCADIGDGRQLLESVRTHRPNIVLLDISLEDMDGLDLLRDLKISHPKLPAMVLSMHDETLYAERALRAGARGYLMKQQAIEQIAKAIRKILAGEIHISDQMAKRMLRRVADGNKAGFATVADVLSDRERQILEWIGRGFSTREIAEQLHRSIKTIEAHRERIKAKLGLKTAAELVRYALAHTEKPRGS